MVMIFIVTIIIKWQKQKQKQNRSIKKRPSFLTCCVCLCCMCFFLICALSPTLSHPIRHVDSKSTPYERFCMSPFRFLLVFFIDFFPHPFRPSILYLFGFSFFFFSFEKTLFAGPTPARCAAGVGK